MSFNAKNSAVAPTAAPVRIPGRARAAGAIAANAPPIPISPDVAERATEDSAVIPAAVAIIFGVVRSRLVAKFFIEVPNDFSTRAPERAAKKEATFLVPLRRTSKGTNRGRVNHFKRAMALPTSRFALIVDFILSNFSSSRFLIFSASAWSYEICGLISGFADSTFSRAFFTCSVGTSISGSISISDSLLISLRTLATDFPSRVSSTGICKSNFSRARFKTLRRSSLNLEVSGRVLTRMRPTVLLAIHPPPGKEKFRS